jgi:hypothetical protein
MSGTTTGAEPADAAPPPPVPDDDVSPATAHDESSTDPADGAPDASTAIDSHDIDTEDIDAPSDAAPADSAADPEVAADTVASHPRTPVEDELGFAVPTWYVLFCALPFAAAFLVPITVIYQAQNSVPAMSATSAAWLGVATGWVLWLIGTAGWLLGPVVLAGPRRRSPTAWEWWHRTTRAWVAVVLAWGLVATLSVLAVAVLLGRLSA